MIAAIKGDIHPKDVGGLKMHSHQRVLQAALVELEPEPQYQVVFVSTTP